ncbi:MAG: glycosyltransferase family 2 protein, partial [Acidobacteriota bacterium]
MSTARCELSIVLPCLNEAATVATCVGKARQFLDRSGIDGEVVVADNGSSDGSAELAAAAGARVVHVAERGYGSALTAGIAAAHGTFVIMADADDSYDLANLDEFVERLRQGWELVMGNRFRGGIARGAMPFLHRYLGNPLLSGLGRLFFSSPCRDFHCGLRGFRREAILGLGLRATGMEFASEMVVKATLAGLRITEVPTTLVPDGRGTPSKLRTWRDGWRHLRFLLLFSPRWLFLYPGLVLMAVGAAVTAWLLPGPRQLASLTLDVHTLLYAAAAILIGFKGVSFAILSRAFATAEGLLPPAARWRELERRLTLEGGLVVGAFLV